MDPGLRGSSCSSSRDADDSALQDITVLDGSQAAAAQAHKQQQQQQPQQQPHRLGFLSALPSKKEVVRQFTSSWLTVTMGTGTVALSLAAFPFKFSGQDEICMALWSLNVVLFVLFSCLMLGRALFYPDTMMQLYRHTNQSLFVGAIPMAFSTITNGVVAFLIPRHGVVASQVAQALFWTNLPGVMLCIALIPFSMFTIHEHAMHSMTAVWLMPVVPACVAANTAGMVAKAVSDEKLGMAIAFIGVSLLGIGFLLSYQITSIYYNRLICHKLPAREVIVSSFLPVGPMAMSALALMNLALAVDHHLLPYAHSQWVDTPIDDTWLPHIGQLFTIAAGLVALAVWGFAVWWLVVAISCITDTLRQGIPLNLGLWGSVFPVGILAITTCQLAVILHSPGMQYLGAFFVCVHVVLWLVVVGLTAQRAWLGQLFHAPCLHAASLKAAAQSAAVPGAAPVTASAQGKATLAATQALAELEDKLASTCPSSSSLGKRPGSGGLQGQHNAGRHTA